MPRRHHSQRRGGVSHHETSDGFRWNRQVLAIFQRAGRSLQDLWLDPESILDLSYDEMRGIPYCGGRSLRVIRYAIQTNHSYAMDALFGCKEKRMAIQTVLDRPDFPSVVRDAMVRMGYRSLRDISRATGTVDPPTVSKIISLLKERSTTMYKNDFSDDKVRSVANALELDPEDFLTVKNGPPSPIDDLLDLPDLEVVEEGTAYTDLETEEEIEEAIEELGGSIASSIMVVETVDALNGVAGPVNGLVDHLLFPSNGIILDVIVPLSDEDIIHYSTRVIETTKQLQSAKKDLDDALQLVESAREVMTDAVANRAFALQKLNGQV